MLKQYKSKSHVAIGIVVNGTNVHVSFTPQTGGGSVYYTDDVQIQKGLQRHPKFGKLFKEVAIPIPVKLVEVKAPAKVKTGPKEVNVACADDAKDYLVEVYGISRTKLKSLKAIKETAEAKGIVFKGI